MIRILVSLLLLFLWCSISFSQAPSPTPPSDDVVKITTTLVQIDVTVTDSKGKIVSDLKAEDFEIFENGQKQEISNFSFFSSVRETVEPVKSIDKIAVPVPPVEIRSDQIRRTIALVVDDLSLSFESAYYVRRSLKKYVDEQMRDGDLVAIIRTSAGIGALQQFTSNKAQLYAAIDKVKWYPLGRGNIGAFAPIEPTTNETLRAAGDDTIADEDIENEKKFLTGFDDFRMLRLPSERLVRCVLSSARWAKLRDENPSSCSPTESGYFLATRKGTTDNYQVFDFMRQLVDLANRASVVFYTVDARGLQTTGINAQDQIVSPSADSIRNAISSRSRELFDTQEGLVFPPAKPAEWRSSTTTT
ncbi:MAG: VWA domain-containing protein [Acidobacteria bacterium]|nr:VWA domain-containing protein [Acidobacteriota bacterium]